MTSLEDLWYGNITPFEQYLDGNEKYQELLPIMARDREKLSEGFSARENRMARKV